MAETTKDIIGPGYTTIGDDGVTYSTTPNVTDDGATTIGSDGSEYVTTKNLLNDGYTTTKTKDARPKPGDKDGKNDDKNKGNAAGDLGAGVILAVIAVVLFTIAGGILSPMTYVWIAAFALAPALSSILSGFHISRVWCSGVLYCYAGLNMISAFSGSIAQVWGTKQGGEGLMTMGLLFLIICGSLIFVMMDLGKEKIGGWAIAVLVIAFGWTFLDMLAPIPYTEQLKLYAPGILLVIACLDQVLEFKLGKRK